MFKVDDRVRESTTTTGAGTYTRGGAPVGFNSFNVLGANNYCPYFATDDTNFEQGIGRVLTGPDRLERTHVLSSSNAGAAVNWGAGTKKLRCGKPGALDFDRSVTKSVAGGADVTLTQLEMRCSVLILTGAITADISVIFDDTPWHVTIVNQTTGAFTLRAKVAGQPGVELYQGRATKCVNTGVDVMKTSDDPPPGAQLDARGTVVEDGYYEEDGSNQLISTDPALYQKLTRRKSGATVTIANPGVWTWNNHKLKLNDTVKHVTTGALPTGVTAGTTYFVKNPTTNTYEVAATEGGASINTTGSQSGVHTAIHAPHGDGDGATTFTLPDSRRRVNVGRGGTALTSVLGTRLGASGGDERNHQHGHGTTEAAHGHTGTALGQGGSSNIYQDNAGSDSGFEAGNSGGSIVGTATLSISSNATGLTVNNSGSGAGENLQPSLVATKWVKR